MANAAQEAELVSQLAVQPLLTPADLGGISAARTQVLDQALEGGTMGAGHPVARVKIWNSAFQVIYSTDHTLIGRTFQPSDELKSALAGQTASEISDLRKAENATDRGYGRLLEVYVPLRFNAEARPAGAFEIYQPYRPIAASIAGETRKLYVLLLGGLALLYVVLLPIVARASRQLRRQADENAHWPSTMP